MGLPYRHHPIANIAGIFAKSKWGLNVILATAVLDSVLTLANITYLYLDPDLLIQYYASVTTESSGTWIIMESVVVLGYYAWVIGYVLQLRKLAATENIASI